MVLCGSPPLSPARVSARRGVSLLEVLVSMSIILVGVLLVAALLPVASFNMIETAKRERGTACAKAAANEVAVRRIVPEDYQAQDQWFAWYDNNHPYPNWTGSPPAANWYSVPNAPVSENNLQYYQGYVIDPLFITQCLASGESAANVARFPYTSAYAEYTNNPNASLYLGRISWSASPAGPTPTTAQQWSFFDRFFTWPDEQVFDIPKDPQARPIRSVNGAGAGNFDGNYSWMITVMPVFNTGGVWGGTYDKRIVVFYKRDFSLPTSLIDPDKPGERLVEVEFLGGGYGGGDVELRTRAAGEPSTRLDLRENEWILVTAWRDTGGAGALQPPRIAKVFQWYRVAWIEDEARSIAGGRYARYATLAGADWAINPLDPTNPPWRIDADGDNTIDWSAGSADSVLRGVGVICTGVIGVYQIK